jgi:hypothetical protein
MNEEKDRVQAAAIALTAGGLIAALYWLLKGGGGGSRSDAVTDIDIDADGNVTGGDVRLPVSTIRQHSVMWRVRNRGAQRCLAFENFQRGSKAVTPLDKTLGNRCPKKIPGFGHRHYTLHISREAVRDLFNDPTTNRHEYKYDVWLDRERRADPVIAIIKSSAYSG